MLLILPLLWPVSSDRRVRRLATWRADQQRHLLADRHKTDSILSSPPLHFTLPSPRSFFLLFFSHVSPHLHKFEFSSEISRISTNFFHQLIERTCVDLKFDENSFKCDVLCWSVRLLFWKRLICGCVCTQPTSKQQRETHTHRSILPSDWWRSLVSWAISGAHHTHTHTHWVCQPLPNWHEASPAANWAVRPLPLAAKRTKSVRNKTHARKFNLAAR